jgi:hypothetical protein
MKTLPDIDLPVFEREACPKCGAVVWHKYSRVDPWSTTDEEFKKEYRIDKETKEVVRK